MTNKSKEIGWKKELFEDKPLPDNALALAVVKQSDSIVMKKSRRSSSSTDSSHSRTSSSSGHSSTGNSNCDDDKQNRKRIKKEKRHEERKLKKETKRIEKIERKKLKRAKKEQHREEKRQHKDEKRTRKLQKKAAKRIKKNEDDCAIPIDLMFTKAQAPETPEEYKARQNQIRRELDPITGRSRLIKGDGEILEEIVSRERHLTINKQATRGDGDFFQLNTINLNFK